MKPHMYDLVLFLISMGALIGYIVALHFRWQKKLEFHLQKAKDKEMQIFHLEKLASLGIISSGIAKEINVPLTFLVSNLQGMSSGLAAFAGSQDNDILAKKKMILELKESITECIDNTHRMTRIVNDLAAFSKISKGKKSFVDINKLIDATLRVLWNSVKTSVDITKDLKARSKVWMDPNQVSQIILSLLVNAVDSLKEYTGAQRRGVVSIFTFETEKSIFIRITDNGCGIKRDDISKIFEPFFTTKNATGLGLYVCRRLVEHNGGKIEVQSHLDRGSSFTIIFPQRVERQD